MDPRTAHLLLDADRMAAIVAQLGLFQDAPVVRLELAATWVKPGRYFNAYYRVLDGAGEALGTSVSAFIVDPARGRRVVEKAGVHTCTDRPKRACSACGTAYVEPGILLQLFPADYRLPTLSGCLNPRRVREATNAAIAPVDCEVVAYRPGMRCQIKYALDGGGTGFGKLSVEKRGRGYAFAVHRSLFEELAEKTQHLRLPEPLMYADELRLSLMAAAEGESLASIMRSGKEAGAELARVAAALAELHGVDSSITTRSHPPAGELELLAAWARLIGAMYPPLGGRMEAGLRALASSTPATSSVPSLLHRDFYDKQVLLGPERINLLDMDTASLGDRELDVANFCVHAWLRGVQHGTEGEGARLADAFSAAYPRALDGRRLAWYRRATLLRLAGNYVLRPRWRHVVEAIMDEAERSETVQ